MIFSFKKSTLPTAEQALPGRLHGMLQAKPHFVTGNPIMPPFPEYLEQAVFGMGCFWGAERKFWLQPGVFSTAAGYAGGFTPNPTYAEICTGMTAHTEVVLVVFDPERITYADLLAIFWESHNPTQGMRQGNDTGTQYRSAIYTFDDRQQSLAELSKGQYQHQLTLAGLPAISTEIRQNQFFYYAEDEHQQYLAKNPHGYCGLNGVGINYEQ